MSCKAVETTHNISKNTMQGWFMKFSKNMRALKMRSIVPSHWKLTTTSESYHWSWSSYNYMRSCSRTQHGTFYGHWHLKQIGKVKTLNKWVPHELTKNQKKLSFWSVIFSFSTQQQWAVSCLTMTCDEKWILYDKQRWPAQLLEQRKLQIFPKSNLHPKKVIVTVWCYTAHLIHYSFLNPGETITSEKYAHKIDGMHWKLQCLPLALVNGNGPFLHNAQPHVHNRSFRSWINWAMKFYLPCSCDLSSTDNHFFKHLHNILQGKCFHN